MIRFNHLRRLFFDFRKRLFPQRKKDHPDPVIEDGLPPEIDHALVNQVCQEHFDAPLRCASHQHLSAWKETGAYRLFCQTTQGADFRLIYKEAVYTTEHIPALAGLPVRPGVPEFTIYSQPPGPLAPYLPTIYLAQELVPGQRYLYILEDLEGNYHRAADEREIIRFAALLPEVHQALEDWKAGAVTHGLIDYGYQFSVSLEQYARSELEAFGELHPLPALDDVLARWNDISTLHLAPEYFDHPFHQPIHGDTNFTNIHFHNQDPRRVKLVDWEWAGFGSPYADLASLLKGTSLLVEQRSLKGYSTALRSAAVPVTSTARQLAGIDQRQGRRFYLWCQLERGLLDASFLAAQYRGSAHQASFSLPNAIRTALIRVIAAYQELSRLK